MKFAPLLSWTFGAALIALTFATVVAHERKEVAGLEVVFGAELAGVERRETVSALAIFEG